MALPAVGKFISIAATAEYACAQPLFFTTALKYVFCVRLSNNRVFVLFAISTGGDARRGRYRVNAQRRRRDLERVILPPQVHVVAARERFTLVKRVTVGTEREQVLIVLRW